MATQKEKVYRISIQTDAALQAVADTSKKLAELDAQLEGLDRDSDQAKGIVAQMAKLAEQLTAAEGKVESLGASLDDIKPGTIPALEADIEALEAAFRQTVRGTAEFDQALIVLGNKKGELKKIEDAIDALDPKEKAAAFVDFANGIVGAFSIAETAATSFGLGSDTVKEYEERLQSLLVVMSGFEAVSKSLNSETLSVVKSTLASAKAYLFAGESASTSSKVTRAALVSTGIGAIIVLVGLLVANWDKLTSTVKGSEKFFTKVKAVSSGLFDSAIASVKNFAGVIEKVFEGDFSGAAAKAKNIGKEVGAAYTKGFEESIFESHRKELQAQVDAAARQIEVLKAKGRDTFKEEEKNLLDRLRLQKQGTDDEKKAYLDLQKDLAVLRATYAKKETEESQAATLARLDARIALEQAKGEEAFQKQLAREQKQLAILRGAADPNAAAIIAQQNKIDTLRAQHDAEQVEKRRAALVLAQQNELAILDKQGQDTLALRIKFAEQLLALDHDGTEKQRTQRDADYQALLLLEEEYNAKVREGLKENQAQRQDIAEQGRESDKAFIDAAGGYLQEAYTKNLAKVPFDLGTTILTKLFGVKPEDVEGVKGQIAEAYAAVSAVVTNIATTLLSENIASLDSQISAVQERIGQLDQQAQDHNQAAKDAESQLATAGGARRDYLIGKINAERAAEAKALADKKKAAAEELRLDQERAKSQKELQAISLATTAATAVEAGVKAIASAASIGFPQNIPAILVAIATVGSAVAASRQLGKSLGNGGVIEGGSHASGNDVPVFGGRYRVEGGEGILPVDATNNNFEAFELLRTKGRNRKLGMDDFMQLARESSSVRVLPPPTTGYYANGGVLGGRGGQSGQSSDAGLSVLAARLDQQSALLTQMVAHLGSVAESSADTANHTGTIRAYGPPVLEFGHDAELRRRELSDGMDQAEQFADPLNSSSKFKR